MSDSQKNFYKKLLGRSGEQRAKRYLKRKGYSILECNYTTRFGEIDLIVYKNNICIFVEVKTRENENFGRPADAVTPIKQQKYRILAQQYVGLKGMEDSVIRFDVIEILGKEINHIENAF